MRPRLVPSRSASRRPGPGSAGTRACSPGSGRTRRLRSAFGITVSRLSGQRAPPASRGTDGWSRSGRHGSGSRTCSAWTGCLRLPPRRLGSRSSGPGRGHADVAVSPLALMQEALAVQRSVTAGAPSESASARFPPSRVSTGCSGAIPSAISASTSKSASKREPAWWITPAATAVSAPRGRILVLLAVGQRSLAISGGSKCRPCAYGLDMLCRYLPIVLCT
jgi:hypothetical protein